MRLSARHDLRGIMNDVERLICTHLQHEGIGSLYERLILSRWLPELAQTRGYSSILEYGVPITHGYDNVILIKAGLDVTIADAQATQVERDWPFPWKPTFVTPEAAPSADLVWSFAHAQLDPSIVATMKKHSKRDVLVMVPNFFNHGAPFHAAYHLLTGTTCGHAERGSKSIRTHAGLKRLVMNAGLRVVTSGFLDAPPIPDIAFSIRELKEVMGAKFKKNGHTNGTNGLTNGAIKPAAVPAAAAEAAWKRIDMLTRFEDHPFTKPFKFLNGHHIFVLGTLA